MVMRAGIDVGSTTVKLVFLNKQNQSIFTKYERHFSDVKAATERILKEGLARIGADQPVTMSITGSGGMGLAEVLGIPLFKRLSRVHELLKQ